MNEKDELLRRIQGLEFALVDLGQYLDTHPGCVDGLAHFKKLKGEHQQAVTHYEERYGSLTPGSGGNIDYWDWVATPWPWELPAAKNGG